VQRALNQNKIKENKTVKQQWYEIILECTNNPTSKTTREVIAKVKSKGLAFIVYQKLQEVYQGSPDTNVKIIIDAGLVKSFIA